jgi:hypothetical protein
LQCHILSFADKEATSPIRRLLALWAVRNINLKDSSGIETPLSHAMGRHECRLPLDVCPTLGAVQVPFFITATDGREEEGFIRHKSIHADVMRRLHLHSTLIAPNSQETCKARVGMSTPLSTEDGKGGMIARNDATYKLTWERIR